MKKNSLFSFKLYREALHQLRVFAIVPLIFMFLALVINFASNCIYATQTNFTQEMLDASEISPLMPMAFCLCAPLLMLVLFQFLNRRNQSDFYHAIPQPRQCVAISYLAAVFTWIVIYTTVPTLFGAFLYRFFLYKYYVLDMSLALSGALNTLVIALLIMAALFLAMTVTGTLFSNVIVTSLILFLPRILITIVNATFAYNIIPASSLAFPFGPFNMLFNLFFGVFDSSNGLYPFNGPALLYTTGLALLYFLFGLFLFKRRPSEAAGNAAPSRKIQAFHRIVLTCAVAFPITLLFINEPPTSAEDILLYIIGYIVAIVVYFMYELLSTRTVRNMVKIIPGLLIVVVACTGGALLSRGFYNLLLNDVPKANEVKQIYIEEINDYYSMSSSGIELYDEEDVSYFDEQLGKLAITDKECITIASNRLAEVVKKAKADSVNYDGQWAAITFERKNGRKISRLVPITSEDTITLQNALKADKEYTNVFCNLPEYKNNFSSVLSIGGSLSTTQKKEIYNCLKEEIKTLDKAVWCEAVSSYGMENGFAFLNVYMPHNGVTMYMNLPIGTLTPNTLALTQKYAYQAFDAEAFKKALHVSEDITSDDFSYWNYTIDISTDNIADANGLLRYSLSTIFESPTLTEAQKKAYTKKWNDAVDALAACATAEFDVTKPYATVYANLYLNEETYFDGSFYIAPDDKTIPEDVWGLAPFLEAYDTDGVRLYYGEETSEPIAAQ